MTDSDKGLVAKYTFDGNSNDTSGNKNHCKVHGASLTTDRFGNADSAYAFDGVDDYIITNKLASAPTTETMSLWIYAMASGVIVSELGQPKTGIGYHYIKLGINTDNELRGNFWACNGDLSFGQISLNQWHHITLIHDGAEERAYLNGDLKATYTGSRSGPGAQYLAFGATDGQRAGGFNDSGYFKGKIDDVRVYNRVLTDAEITQLSRESASVQSVSPQRIASRHSSESTTTETKSTRHSPAGMATVTKSTDSASLAEIVDRILEKGIVVDAWAKVSIVGIELLAVEARVVVASVETYLKYAEAIGLTAPIAAPRAQFNDMADLLP